MEYKAQSIFGFVMFMVSHTLYFLTYATLLLGLALCFTPAYIKQLNDLLYKPKTFRKEFKPAEMMRDTNLFFTSNRKLVGTLLLLGSLEVTYFFAFQMDVEAFRGIWVSGKTSVFFTDIIFETLRISFVIGGITAFTTLLFFLFSPEKFDRISNYADSWVSSRMVLMPLEKDRAVEGNIFFKYHKMFGLFIAIGSLYSIFMLKGLPSQFKF